MIEHDCGNGLIAVPHEAVTLNGIYLPRLNTQEESKVHYWHLVAPNGRAVDGETGGPYIYKSLDEAKEDAAKLAGMDEYSTCGGVVTKTKDANMWVIKRDGRVYDRLNPMTHAVTQIAASLSNDMPLSLFEVFDEKGRLQYTIGPPMKEN
jgi:hypothetical protein